ncbi:MAG TPA: hypothetical protein VG755_17930, partial [Nannocystaceae bacterium]|nr:hypothetical protein [Nannocystaceae bacterium]
LAAELEHAPRETPGMQREAFSGEREAPSAQREAFSAQREAFSGERDEGSGPRAEDGGRSYGLRTRALAADYAGTREQLRGAADALGALRAREGAASEREEVVAAAAPELPELLDCLPGPVALVRWQDDLLAVDLRAVRSFLLERRLAAELGGGGVLAQTLLVPAVVQVSSADLELCIAAHADLLALGIVIDGFGEDAVIVRAVPAELRRCVDDVDAAALLAKVLPYLRTRARDRGAIAHATAAIVELGARDVAPRWARRFLRELAEQGVELTEVPGVQRWSASDLVGGRPR